MNPYAIAHALISLLFSILGAITGWVYAYATVATECDRLGSFYVAEKTYACNRKETP